MTVMSVQQRQPRVPLTFMPRLGVEDPGAAYWLRQVTLRLRREVCWLWRERALLATDGPLQAGADGGLPPFVERLGEVLDLARYDEEKHAFFVTDDTAAYLSRLIAAPPPRNRRAETPVRGGFAWVARTLDLEPVDCFVLGLALAAAVDSAVGSVFAACLNDPSGTHATPALAQRLWDRPQALASLLDPTHRLVRYGLLAHSSDWDARLIVPSLVAQQLVFPTSVPAALADLPPPTDALAPTDLELVVARLATAPADRAVVVPIHGVPDAPLAAAAARVANALGCASVQPALGVRAADLPALATLSWLRSAVLYVPFDLLAQGFEGSDAALTPPLPGLPAPLLVGIDRPASAQRFAVACTLPPLQVPALDYHQRLKAWRSGMAAELAGHSGTLDETLQECARRFRYEEPAIARLCQVLNALGRPVEHQDVFDVCRADVELGDLAQAVVPRFTLADLMLPHKQTQQVDELIQSVQALTTVHYEWGTARAWNESGLSALFAGPPGTGKTMAAEVIATTAGMPLFRIDLSQVVNKYVGETEKNLRRLFDAADIADVVLFFDEADALFGKRTEVKDAHDRYANLEVSYLLERMERFRGLAILATNRKKDLDEAFMRRLRFVIDFPLPSARERLRIWRSVVPAEVNTGDLDFDFLAERFALAGGHIRAIVFQACLQSARRGQARRLEMAVVLRAVARELDKLGRAISLEQFAPYPNPLED